jgi:hypothetical protein
LDTYSSGLRANPRSRRGSTLSSGQPPADPDIGSFQATTLEGEPLSHETLKPGVSLVGFFTAHCKPCTALRAQLLKSPPALPFVAFVEGRANDPEVGEMAEALKRIARVVYTERNDALHQAFQPASYPTLIRVENGIIAASGHALADVLP